MGPLVGALPISFPDTLRQLASGSKPTHLPEPMLRISLANQCAVGAL